MGRLINSKDIFGPSSAYTIINTYDFLTASQIADAQSWGGAYDLTTPIANAIAAIPTTGGGLYFPPGRYVTTGGFTISKPFLIFGNGSHAGDASSSAISQIECSSASAKLFTASAVLGIFRDISLVCTSGSPVSGSSAVYAYNAANAEIKISYENVATNGFYDPIDSRTGQGWWMQDCQLYNFANWGLRIRNDVNADAGDFRVFNNIICGAQGAAAGIRWESSGGGLIQGNKLNVPDGVTSVVRGIDVAMSGTSTQAFILDNMVENVSAEPLRITNAGGLLGWMVGDNFFRTLSATAAAMNIDAMGRGVIGNNVLVGNGGTYAYILTNLSNVDFDGRIVTSGFTNRASIAGTNYDSQHDGPQRFFDQLYDNWSKTQGAVLSNFPMTFRRMMFAGSGATASEILQGFNGATQNGALLQDASSNRWRWGGTTNNTGITTKAGFFDATGNFGSLNGALATTATNGFAYVAGGAGPPTGVPAFTEGIPLYYDTTNNKLYIYNGSWKGVVLA